MDYPRLLPVIDLALFELMIQNNIVMIAHKILLEAIMPAIGKNLFIFKVEIHF